MKSEKSKNMSYFDLDDKPVSERSHEIYKKRLIIGMRTGR